MAKTKRRTLKQTTNRKRQVGPFVEWLAGWHHPCIEFSVLLLAFGFVFRNFAFAFSRPWLESSFPQKRLQFWPCTGVYIARTGSTIIVMPSNCISRCTA